MTKSPSVIVPARIDRPPMTIISTPIMPGDHRRARADGRRAGDRLGDVAEQLVRAAREDEPLARLGDVDLHEADAAERLGRAGR